MSRKIYAHAEPVPLATQLLALPFLSSVYGYLASDTATDLRVTAHRVMTQRGTTYLQQVCGYANAQGVGPQRDAGRVFSVDTGILGASYSTANIWRTKFYPSDDALIGALTSDMKSTNDERKPSEVAWSYLAIPFLTPARTVALVFYADCKTRNFFASDEKINTVVGMCGGYAKLLDALHSVPIPGMRNYDVRHGIELKSDNSLYPNLHEALSAVEPPVLKNLKTLNFESK